MTPRAAGHLLSALALAVALMGLACAATKRSVDPDAAPSPSGEAIYLKGLLVSGAPLVGSRADAEPLSGEQAACANCHRPSGLGGTEGRNVIPPITGQFLFHPLAERLDEVQLPYIPGARPDRTPYTEATLARALREGVSSEGRDLSYLMPRYALDDVDLAALINHLRTLDHRHVPGVSSMELHFATIIAPDADPVARRGMLAVLQQFFEDRNIAPRGLPALTMAPSGNTAFAKGMFKVNRRWVLHVWEPTGPPETWTEQLEKNFAAQPVFAVISGLAGRDWTPISTFCERRAVPCLFPNVAQPPADADQNFHTLYFSRGVLLEADLIGAGLLEASVGTAPKRVRQIYRAGDIGEAGAHALAAVLGAKGVVVASRAIPRDAPSSAVAEALRDISSADALVLWLRQPDLAALEGRSAPPIPLFMSGVMAGVDEPPVPQGWRDRAHIAYPIDLPERRRVRVDYALGWFRIRNIPVVAEQVQVDTYLACGLLSETLKHMVDAFVADYLIERLEDTVEHRILTGYYPRLSLGPHQRFASKGGFLVHFDAGNSRLTPDGEWMTP